MKQKSGIVYRVIALVLILLAVVSNIFVYRQNRTAFYILITLTTIFGIAALISMYLSSVNIHKFIAQMNENIIETQRESLYNFPAPTSIVNGEGKVIWYNKLFVEELVIDKDPFGLILSDIIPVDILKAKAPRGQVIEFQGNNYRVLARSQTSEDNNLTMIYFEDITDHIKLEIEHAKSRPTIVLMMIDNYDDLLQNVKESEKANVLVQLEKLLEQFMESTTGVIRKISNDRFVAIFDERHIEDMVKERFNILDKARQIRVNDRLCVTLSIGVGRGASSLFESELFAKQALDMALGRGGDQAAVKTINGFEFFGGVSKGIEKHAKVKTRIIATALSELIQENEKVLIMGHRFGDLDSIGSAVGIAGAIHRMGKEAKIAVDPEKNLAKVLINHIKSCDEKDMFISVSAALDYLTDNTLLIIVDTHNKDFIESFEIYQRAKHITVIDHHRKTVNFIDNAVIFYHEPYASSASEMVSELIQYFGDAGKLPAHYAEALLSGIMLDTKSFVMKTGVRTFEAAAYLRRLGADTVAVRGMFSSSIDSYQRKTRIVASAEVYGRCAVATSDFKSDDIRVIAPQAADELLGISGVDASYVLYDIGGVINISARSMGAMNVQVIMEKMGGGGHQTMAATQLEGTSLESARQLLLDTIDEYLKEFN